MIWARWNIPAACHSIKGVPAGGLFDAIRAATEHFHCLVAAVRLISLFGESLHLIRDKILLCS
jgi:hypothetical protein